MSAKTYATVDSILLADVTIQKRFGKQRSIRTLQGGARSLVSLVTAAKGKFVLKRKIEGGRHYDIEYTNLLKESRIGIAPKPYAYGTVKGTNYIAIEYVEGKRLPKRGMSSADIKDVATTLGKVLKPAPGTTDLKERIEWDGDYAKRWMDEAQKYRRLEKDAARAREAYDRLPIPKNIQIRNRYRHGDPNPHNFIRNGQRLVLIDWDNRSKPSLGEIELADFAIKAHLSAEKRELWKELFPWCKTDVFELGYRYRLASLIGWHFERLVKNERKEFSGPFYGGNRESEVRTMRTLIRNLERAIQ